MSFRLPLYCQLFRFEKKTVIIHLHENASKIVIYYYYLGGDHTPYIFLLTVWSSSHQTIIFLILIDIKMLLILTVIGNLMSK